MYKTNGICDSPSHTVEYNIEFLIDQESEFYYNLTHINGEYELFDSSYLPITQDDLYFDNNETFIDNIIAKLKEL